MMTLTPVFTDASSAILLEKVQLFSLFLNVFDSILAQTVFDEITMPGYAGAESFKRHRRQNNFVVKSVKESKKHCTALNKGNLDTGEKDTLRLFLGSKKGFILTDDKQAAKYCLNHHLPFINALLVPKVFWYGDIINKKVCEKKMAVLSTIGRYSEKITWYAFNCTQKDLIQFIPE